MQRYINKRLTVGRRLVGLLYGRAAQSCLPLNPSAPHIHTHEDKNVPLVWDTHNPSHSHSCKVHLLKITGRDVDIGTARQIKGWWTEQSGCREEIKAVAVSLSNRSTHSDLNTTAPSQRRRRARELCVHFAGSWHRTDTTIKAIIIKINTAVH